MKLLRAGPSNSGHGVTEHGNDIGQKLLIYDGGRAQLIVYEFKRII